MPDQNKQPRLSSKIYEEILLYYEDLYSHPPANSSREQVADRILAPLIVQASRLGHSQIELELVELWRRWTSKKQRHQRR